jgi:hypothetical protein
MRIKLIFFLFFFLIFANSTNANIYWLYEFYNISPNFNIFSLNDDKYQKCLKENLGEKDYKKAVEYKSSITQKMEDAADQCVEKLLISQSNPELQLCLENELTDQSYNNLITKQFSKSPGKNDFKAFYKCLSELKTKTVVANNEQYNESNSCPKGYKLVNNSCQSDGSTSSGSCPEGYKLVNNSCQSDGSKQKSNDLKKVTENKLNIKKKKYNLNDPALNKCFKKMLGEKRYQEIIFSGSEKPNAEENTSIVGCQQNPDSMWQGSLALGYNTPDYYYDIFDGNKVKDCISSPKHVFTNEITDFSQIKRLERWGQTPQGNLKNHTYIFLKNKGRKGNKVIIDKPVPVYAPIDSYLILQTRYRLSASGLKDIQWRLMFQVGCELVYRFDHLDTPSDRILKYIGNIQINEDQDSAPNAKVLPPLKIKAGEIVAYTKGTPMAGSWDFGVLDISNNNDLPKRLKKYENHPTGRGYKYAACPYDYYPDKIKKKYLKKMKRKKCNPKEIKNK